ncbi:hypothetical protein TUBRATIS_26350 [Tubulinosema ratisbonensis]|uniref:Uncharacterized protein n=1 Tax=Tubulinosema ratisbonensis TaxID=291195 RepID=A0A437AIC5_9MICR|nr:hypothetical protein TUBRATIS_26350 [Tubulinosema ratisbonensis]
MFTKVLYLVLPNYRFIKYIEEKIPMNLPQYLLKVLFLCLFAFLTFIGIRKQRISTTILTLSLSFGAMLRVIEKLTQPYDQNIPLINILTEENYNHIKNSVLDNQEKYLIITFFVGLVLGYSLEALSFLTKVIFSGYIAISTMDSGLTVELKNILRIKFMYFDYLVGFLIFLIVFYFTKFVYSLCLGLVFSLYGSFFLLTTFEEIRENNSLGLDTMVLVDGNNVNINVNVPGFLLVIFTAMLGFLAQVYILKRTFK